MKILAVTLLALVAVASARNIRPEDVIDLDDITAYGYLTKIGVPLAEELLKAEEEAKQNPTRIVGGSAARLGQFPWQAGLVIALTNGRQSVCGGSLLNQRRVVTAAHCWNDGIVQARTFTVVLGSITLFTGGQRFETSNVIVHNQWFAPNIQNDVAMTRLNSAASLSNNVRAIGLPSGSQLNNNFVGVSAVASGFGLTRDGGQVSNTLQHVTVPIITNQLCSQTFGPMVRPENICTSGAGGRNTCNGDSGGPLVVNNNILVGITSFGVGSGCQRGLPAAFARVTSFNTWIRRQM